AVYDIRDPSLPIFRYTLNSHSPLDMQVIDHRLIVADGIGGLTILDVSEPQAAYVMSHHPTPGSARGVAFKDGYALVANREGGLQIVAVNPRLENLVWVDETTISVTVPTGYTPGPYDVRAEDPETGEATLPNALLICALKTIEARLDPVVDPDAGHFVWPLAWRASILDRTSTASAGYQARLRLPSLPGEVVVTDELVADASRDTIEITLSAAGDRAEVTLTGADTARLRERWVEAISEGGFQLPALSATSFGDVRLALETELPAGRLGAASFIPVPHGEEPGMRFRYDLEDGVLLSARGWGAAADMTIETTLFEANGCRSSLTLSYRDELRDRCYELADELPGLASLCDTGKPLMLPATHHSSAREQRHHVRRRAR
ncbi:MAG: hypothetical protein JSV80_01680, partial [Acidobacteriota bacterium]